MAAGLPLLDGLTNTQAVLGSAGMSAGDIGDARLIATQIEDELELRLFRRVPNWSELYLAGQDPLAGAADRMIGKALRNYVKYLGASILVSKWLGIKKMVSDGKVRSDRFDRMDLALMQANIDGHLAAAEDLLAELTDPEWGNRAPPTFFGVSSPIVDPVVDNEEGL